MDFKDIKKGYTVYILRKCEDGVKAGEGKVVDVYGPHMPPPDMTSGMATSLTQMQQKVVDVTVEENGQKVQYRIPENVSVTSAGDIILSTDREGIIREAQAMMAHSDDVIKSVPHHEKIKKECAAILETWDQSYKERRDNEKRFSGMEQRMDGFDNRLTNMDDKLTLILTKLN